jgi:Flp pilus assembly protein TadG
MLCCACRKFLNDESGAYAVWSLLWFSLYVAMGGLAVDMTDAYRNQTLLQATADASALAGAISLPNEADAVAMALAYSSINMDPAINENGNVLLGPDVIVGNWNFGTRVFSTGAGSADTVEAVLVTTRRSNANDNALATNFLRIMNLWGIPGDVWNIATEAIAVKYIPECLDGGMVAANQFDSQGGGGYYNELCIHGQNMDVDPGLNNGVEFQSNNYIESGVSVSSPDLDDVSYKNNNEGIEEALAEGDLYPKDAFIVNDIIAGLTDPASDYMPDYIDTDPVTGAPNIYSPPQGNNYAGPYDAGTIYDVNCSSDNKILSLPTGVLIEKVVIVTNCKIKASNGLIVTDVVLASTSTGNGKDPLSQNSIDLAATAQFGSNTFCSDDPVLQGTGGVELYSAASAHVTAGANAGGMRVVVAGSFDITSNADIFGISFQAGNDISVTSGGKFGLCENGTRSPGKYTWHYRLVQ